MASLQQCPNGHYFDPSIHPSCPYCSNASASVDRSVRIDYPASVADYDFPTAPPARGNSDAGFTPSYDAGPTEPPKGAYGSSDFSYPGHSDGNTVPPQDYSGHTVPVMPQRKKDGSETSKKDDDAQWLVVGWLVAVEGPYRGKSFEIHHGNTYIGREEGDIILKKDKAVSGSRQANTVYEERKNRFLLVAGQSTNLVYVDDELLPNSSHVELKPYSSIELGKSKFLFVPFCTDQFKWSDESN